MFTIARGSPGRSDRGARAACGHDHRASWTLEVTHAGTGEEIIVRINAETHEDAEARARDGGLLVRDCYVAGGERFKAVRAAAWVWFCLFALLAAVAALQAADLLWRGVRDGFGALGAAGFRVGMVVLVFVGLAAPGLAVVRAMTVALRGPSRVDPRHGFEMNRRKETQATT